MNTLVNALREAHKYIAEISAAADKLIVIADGYDDPDCTDARVALRAVLDRAATTMSQVVVDDTAIRADAAEAMVCELREKARAYLGAADLGGVQERAALIAAVAGTDEVASRWVLKSDFDALLKKSSAECLRLHADVERYRHTLDRINAIRNSIVQRQAIDWSSHIYPIVAALNDAGIQGDGYDVTRAKALTEVEAIKQRIAAEVVAERDAARAEVAALRVVVDAARYQKVSGMFVSAALEMALAALDKASEDIR